MTGYEVPASRADAERELDRLRCYDGRANYAAARHDRVLVELRDERIAFLHGFLAVTS